MTGVKGGTNCCFLSVETGSSSVENRITPFTPAIPTWKSRTRTSLADPILPQVRSCCSVLHQLAPNCVACEVVHTTIEFPPQAAVHQCQSSHELGQRSNQQDLVIGCIPISLIFVRHTRERHVGNNIVQLCKGASWHKGTFPWCLGGPGTKKLFASAWGVVLWC